MSELNVVNRRRVIAVLGMDRSGTSLCASVLGALGMWLGSDLAPGDRFNERGYFEDREIWRVHERLLAILGRSWDTLATVHPMPSRWWQWEAVLRFEDQLAEIASTRIAAADGAIWGFKDPRTVLLLPVWRRVFQRLGVQPVFIVCVRHPAAVADSLAARDSFPRLFSELLWLEKTLAACLGSCDAPNALIHYENWFSEPGKCLELLVHATGLAPVQEKEAPIERVNAIVSREMRHYTAGTREIASGTAGELYGCLLNQPHVPERRALERFDLALKTASEFMSSVEQIGARKLPSSICTPSYRHCTEEDLRFIEQDASGANEFSREHDPALVRNELLVAQSEAQLREYTGALAEAQRLVAEKDLLIQRYAAGLAHAQQLVLDRDAELKRYVEALAQAQSVAADQDMQLRQYDAALAEAQRVARELEARLRPEDLMRREG